MTDPDAPDGGASPETDVDTGCPEGYKYCPGADAVAVDDDVLPGDLCFACFCVATNRGDTNTATDGGGDT